MELLELGSWIGRGQAFGSVANQTLAAQAKCLHTIRENNAYQSVCATWEEFCQQYVGLARRRVDELIEKVEEFGETYFRLAEIVRISPDSYRQIADRIVESSIEIGGELVPIVAENGARIRGAVARLRSEMRQARHEADIHSSPDISRLMSRVDSIYEEMKRQAQRPLITSSQKAELRALTNYTIERMATVAKLVKE